MYGLLYLYWPKGEKRVLNLLKKSHEGQTREYMSIENAKTVGSQVLARPIIAFQQATTVHHPVRFDLHVPSKPCF